MESPRPSQPVKIDSPGTPGSVVAFGDKARVLAVGRSGNSFAPVAVSGILPGERGRRIVLLGHDGYLNAESMKRHDTRQFLLDSAAWAVDRQPKSKARHNVGLIGLAELSAEFREAGWNTVTLGSDWTSHLEGIDLIVAKAGSVKTQSEADALAKRLGQGGGAIIGVTGWGWEMIHPGKRIASDWPLSRLLNEAGIAVSPETLDPEDSKSASMKLIGPEDMPLVHAGKALAKLRQPADSESKLTSIEAAQISSTLELALASVKSDSQFRKSMAELSRFRKPRSITESNPVRSEDIYDRLAIRIRHDHARDTESAKIAADPSSTEFPGPVADNVPRMARTIRFPAKAKGRLGTGLYAPPGGRIRIRVVDSQDPNLPSGLKIRIGAHSDSLWHLDKWERHPEITLVRDLQFRDSVFEIASPFGGLIYIEPAKPLATDVELTFENVVLAPHYVLGESTARDWLQLRKSPAPWAEFRSRHVGLVLPSDAIRNLDDPKQLLELWDRVMDCQNELGTLRPEFKPTQWIVPDRQISAGYMHAGNPIMTGLDAVPFFANPDKLLADKPGGITWGILHEIGHNRQRPAWTPSGLGEVTNNLFALYAYDKLLNKPSAGHPGLLIRENREAALKKYRATGPDFERFKEDPFLALAFFMGIQEEFGWKPFITYFAKIEELPRKDRPETDSACWNSWLTGMSKHTGRNLSPYFEAWGIPISKDATKSMQSLPPWNTAAIEP
jgi:hypothetical protein